MGLQKANIGSLSHCKGALLTLSLIAKEAGAIKSYLYWNGQITRFLPEHIPILFPELFNMKWNNGKNIGKNEKSENETFMEEVGELQKLVNKMNKTLTDKYFRAFIQSYK